MAARRAHNPKVTGSSPVPATYTITKHLSDGVFLFFWDRFTVSVRVKSVVRRRALSWGMCDVRGAGQGNTESLKAMKCAAENSVLSAFFSASVFQWQASFPIFCLLIRLRLYQHHYEAEAGCAIRREISVASGTVLRLLFFKHLCRPCYKNIMQG